MSRLDKDGTPLAGGQDGPRVGPMTAHISDKIDNPVHMWILLKWP